MKRTIAKNSLFGTALVLIALLLTMSVIPLQAQSEYHPVANGCVWSVSNEKYMTAGDTMLDGKTYLKLYRHVGSQPFEFSLDNADYFAAIRNDSAEKKVYAYLPAGTWIRNLSDYSVIQTDTAMDVLLYDFSLAIGDTICYYSIGSSVTKSYAVRAESASIYVGQSGYTAVNHQYSSLDTLVYLSDNSFRNQILLQGLSYHLKDNVWIEGVGGVRGFDEGTQMNLSDYGQKVLLCFSNSVGAIFQTEFDFDGTPDDCFSVGFGGDVPENEMPDITVYPNPVKNQLKIYTQQFDNQNIHIRIFNVMGVCVFDDTFDGSSCDKEVNLGFLPKGIYMIKLEQSKKHFAYKIIKL